jgi:nicotinate-nucleotide adenylyltransferase
MSNERIGLLGGTFDPPHVGHLWLAETAQAQLALDRVLFLPVGEPVHKESEITAVSQRLAMTRLALADYPDFYPDTTDAERPSPHATYTLLPLLRQKYPQAGFWLLIGGDSLRDFATWRQPQQVIAQCRLAVLPRPGIEIDWEELDEAVPGLRTAVSWLDGPIFPLSSTEIRDWVRAGYSVRALVGTAVARYIDQHRLYNRRSLSF